MSRSESAPRPDTLLVHAGHARPGELGFVNPPVYRFSTVLYPDTATYEARDPSDFKTVRYGVHGTPTAYALEEALATLEGGHNAVVLPSGMAAVAVALLAFARPGGHVLVSDAVYGPARHFCEQRLRAQGVEVEYYAPTLGAAIADRLRPDTQLVYGETPGSFTFEMQDIPAMAQAAHARGIPVIADNTWATPYGFRSLEHGVDVSIHAGTKYINGHSDVMLGAIVTNEAHWARVRRTVADYGYCVSPDDCYLALRGLRTLGVRLKHQMQSALTVARWLQERDEVVRVLYPPLESDPGHALWQRDFRAGASLMGVVLGAYRSDSVAAMLDALRLFGIGSSWGGYESLAIRQPNLAPLRSLPTGLPPGALLRLHIGLEDPCDLIADLEAGLALLEPA